MVDVKQLESEINDRLGTVTDQSQLQKFRTIYIGRKGKLTAALRSLGNLPEEERSRLGMKLNSLKQATEKKIHSLEDQFNRQDRDARLRTETVDVTLPGTMVSCGSSHILTTVFRQIIEIFAGFGFMIAEGPNMETDYFNFAALNFPEDHPARDAQDTFFTDIKDDKGKPYILRTHTSPVQIHLMQSVKPPIRAIMPGRVYRHEAVDASHSTVFHQVEGLAVDTGITFADLKGVLTLFVRRMFGPRAKARFRPSFFPFTEPSAEIDIQCHACKGNGCGVCKKTGWIELLGAGMVHPNVFRAVNYDPEKISGFAFGMGVERIAMKKYGIHDIRLFYENDMRFLKQFRNI